MPHPEHHLIYVPGLHDMHPANYTVASLVPVVWRLHGFHGHIVRPHWEEGGEFEPKLKAIVREIGELATQGYYVSLVGQSAGGSAVMNAFMQCPDLITGVVDITGRLRVPGEPSLEKAAKGSPAFTESVRRCEANLPNLTASQRKRIITIRPTADRVVPTDSVAVEGATNLVSPARGHSKGGAQITTIRTQEWMEFLRGLEQN